MLKRWKDWFIYQKAKEREKQKEIVHVVNTNAVVINNVRRPQRNNRSFNRDNRGGGNDRAPKETFEQKMARFLKDSEDRLTSLKRNTESKRGGRGVADNKDV